MAHSVRARIKLSAGRAMFRMKRHFGLIRVSYDSSPLSGESISNVESSMNPDHLVRIRVSGQFY